MLAKIKTGQMSQRNILTINVGIGDGQNVQH
jgi:hypothetical protein